MELETAARKHLLNQDSIRNLVGKHVYKWKLELPLEGTGQTALVVNRRSGWTKPTHNSQEYPILAVECYADNSRRDDNDLPILDDAGERAMQLAREVDRVLHQVDREHRYWPEDDQEGLYVIGCFRSSEPFGPEDKLGVKVVRCTYDMQVVH